MPRRRPPAAPDADDLIVDSATPFQPLDRLNRQLKAAAARLGPSDVRYLVDTYYQLQQQRIAAAHQLRQTAAGEPPNPFMAWFQQSCKTLEGNVKAAMGVVAQQSVPGRWCLSITGIGPVITAGLLAHIDITRTKYPSNLWSFAGVNPDRRWLPHTKRPWNARLKVIAFKIGESFTKFSSHPHDHYGQYYKRRKRYEVDKNLSGARVQTAAEWLERVNFGKDTDAYKWYSGCYTKVQGERYFGAILGGTAPPRLKPGAPGSGLAMLPPQQVHRRAQRFAAKLFLSHLHSVMFEAHYGRPGPPAWVLAYGDHFETWLEEPPVPNWPLAA